MKIVGIIPSRYASTRLPGKPLIDINGFPMIWWVYNRAKQIDAFDDLIVATDDSRISQVCKEYGMPYVMTDKNHPTAANRLKEVSDTVIADYYVQINGDEPLIDINSLKAIVLTDIPQNVEYGVNIVTKIKDPAQVMDSSNIKVVFNDDMEMLYMSRTPIPYPFKSVDYSYYKHVGLIGYNKKMLDLYESTVPGKYETIEGIDTLRFIDYNKTLKVVVVDEYNSLSVDTPKDLDIVRKMAR